jgi:hypothetical protein
MEPSRSRESWATELTPGARVVAPRRGYLHHGVYVGDGMVVHYNARACGLLGGRIEETPLARFARGRDIRVHQSPRSSAFTEGEVVRRARARVGEARYRILANNCEHFCEWCAHGTARSYQVEQLLRSRPALSFLARLFGPRADGESRATRLGVRTRTAAGAP